MRIIISILMITLIACASPQKQMDAWLGKHKSDLILQWGPPANVNSDGQGGEVLSYYGQVNLGHSPGQIKPHLNGSYTYTAPTQNGYTRQRHFFVNALGIIYNHKWQGY